MTENKLNELINTYSKLVYTVCYRFTNDHHEAENLAQETFLAAFKSNYSFEGENSKALLMKIATNKCRDHLKSAYVRKIATTDITDLNQISSDANPLEDIVSKEKLTAIQAACMTLEEPYKSASIEYFLESKNFQEVATKLGRPLKTVQTQIYRSRDKLKSILRKEMFYG